MNLADELAEEEQIGGSLRDLEEALAELSEQNERLEEDCKDLEAHCRDLERLGYPSPCPVEQLLLDPPSQQSTLDAPEMRRPSAETVEVDADARVRELLQAREKSFAAMTEMQERCNHQQNEMEKLLLERSKLQADLMHSKAELQESRYLVQELQAQVEQNDLETLSHTTGDDASSNAESLHSTTSRRARKKRNIKGQGFRQAKCLDEGVELPIQADPTEVLLRSLLSKAQANSLWYELILFLLEKAGEELPPARSESEVQKELQVMANQIKERLQQICGSDETAGVLESVLKTVGKATDQAFDSAVLYVDQKVASSPSSIVGDTVSETRSGPRESTVSEVGESQVATFKQTARDARARLQARRKQRSSVLSVTSRDA
eukprot:symbB.v1.2.030158.t1/scaffold3368.1/size58328/5